MHGHPNVSAVDDARQSNIFYEYDVWAEDEGVVSLGKKSSNLHNQLV